MLVVHADRAVGIQDLFAREFPTLREVRSGSWLTQSVQGNGLGREMRSAVLDLAFHGLGAVVARSDAFAHNDASTSVSRALGYRENGRSRVLSRGKPAEKIEFELTREAWLAARGPASRTRIEGLEPCRQMFAESGVR